MLCCQYFLSVSMCCDFREIRVGVESTGPSKHPVYGQFQDGSFLCHLFPSPDLLPDDGRPGADPLLLPGVWRRLPWWRSREDRACGVMEQLWSVAGEGGCVRSRTLFGCLRPTFQIHNPSPPSHIGPGYLWNCKILKEFF